MTDKNTVLPTLIVTVAWALCLMNLLFGFMYFVLKIAGLQKGDLEKNSGNLVQRYPVVFLADYVLSFILIMLGGAWFAECNGVGKNVFRFLVLDHHTALFWGFLATTTLVFSLLGIKGYFLYKGCEKFPRTTKR